MSYIFFTLIFLTLLFLLLMKARKNSRQKTQEQLRKQWGQPKNEYYNFDFIRKYHTHSTTGCFHQLSPQTLADIDFNELFSFIDRTTSKVGQQALFDKLNKPTDQIDDLQKLHETSLYFKNNPAIREEVQLLLTTLNTTGAYFIADLLSIKIITRPAWLPFVFLDTVLMIALLTLSAWYPVLLIAVMFLFAINMFLHYWNKNNTFQFATSLPQLNILINTVKVLMRKNLPFEAATAEKSCGNLRAFQSKVKFISFGSSGIKDELSQVINYFLDLLKALFLIELHALYNITDELNNKRNDIEHLIQYVGSIDTSISIASLQSGNLVTCQPNFTGAVKELHASALYHPLVNNCVGNDITVRGKSILITGSNMSGKTTFLRSLAVNSISAQTIYLCFADAFHTPVLKLSSSIRIDDNLLEGKSFYFEEVNSIALLIKAADSGYQSLFILDEVFKGTNTIERIACAKAILSHLNKREHLVFVSTHDIELSQMLADEYELYHFVETINHKELQFDHQLKHGPLQSRNAIKILALLNYPVSIIEEAQLISQQLTTATGAAFKPPVKE